MNRTAIIGGALALFIVLGIGGYFAFKRMHTVQAPPSSGGGTVFPGSGDANGGTNGTGPLRTISTSDGGKTAVEDFTAKPGVIQDPNVPGQYDLAGGSSPDASTAYHIFYQSEDDYFGIALYKEPLGQTRRQAEQDLISKLGIPQARMCALNYVVAPGPGVNDAYAGQNLGFSFCPGAVKLP